MSYEAPKLSEGQIIRAPFLQAPARVKKFQQRRAYWHLEVTLETDGRYQEHNLSRDQVEQIELVSRDVAALSSDPEEFFLLIEAQRIRLAHQFDPMLAISVSQVDPLPHQIEAVYHYALAHPQLRFLIADDPGAGKTIMAGLILKEMQARRLVERVLVVAPGHLKYQWQREMKERFGVGFRLIDRSSMRAHWGENVWEEIPYGITSVDFIKQDDVKPTLRAAQWDLVIVDEAHKMSAYAYESKERTKIDKTKRYQVGEELSRQATHLLFLTATPHRGDEENFRLFLDLLRPGFFAKAEQLREAVEREENPLFIRRLKEDMRTFEGRPIFPPRNVLTAEFRMNDAEIQLYNAVTRYVQNYYDQARDNRHITFAMIILQRRLTSSVHAVLSSLKRRRQKLQQLLRLPDKIQSDDRYEGLRQLTEEEIEDLSEGERWELEERLEQLTIASNIHEVEKEIVKLDELIEQAEIVRSQETESKLVKLRDEILDILEGRKLLIFTEHKDTLWYLEGKLEAWGYSVCIIHGAMSLDARIEAERVFRDDAQIMVATEAAGEGINLQFCSLMVNYDIPWNPNRLEQRMGRIHRYGQDREVYIWNLISKDTREGQILDRLFEKLDRMREALGSDRVFDVIGEVIPGGNLSDLLRDAVLQQRRMEEIDAEIEKIDESGTQKLIDRVFLTSLATRHIDYSGLEQERLRAKENRLVPEYVEDFFLRGFRHLGGRVTRADDGYRVESVPFELRQLNDDYHFKISYGKVRRKYSKITFDKKVARKDTSYEFVAPGHPLLEALNEMVLREFPEGGERYAVFADPESQKEGALWFVDGVVTDGTGQPAGRRVFALLQDVSGTIQPINAAVLWDLEPAGGREAPADLRMLIADRDTVEEYVISEVLFPYRDEIAGRREREANIKRRYGLSSLDYLIQESNGKLIEYETRAAAGENMDLAIRNERHNLENLKHRREALEEEIRLESNLTISAPRILGVSAVLSAAAAPAESPAEPEASEEDVAVEDTGFDRDDEIERVGMEVARRYEEERGWQVENVSSEQHGGFDLRSIRYEDGRIAEARYIEVKARAQDGAIRLTANEWKRARQWGDEYWLYVVTNAGTDSPNLNRIQNPAQRFKEGEDIRATGYIIGRDKWKQHATIGEEATTL